MAFERKVFELSLISIAPVHIGSGTSASKKQFIEEKDSYYFPEMDKVYETIAKKGEAILNKYESIILGQYKGGGQVYTLNQILNELNIKERDFGGYRISLTKNDDEKVKPSKPNNISLFIRNGLGQPYIPGSSLKGALRTILVNTEIKKENLGKEQGNLPPLKWGAKKDQEFDDLFNEIQVSDGEWFDEKNLILTQKIDYTKVKNRFNGINAYRESLKPGMTLKFRIVCKSERASQLISNLQKSSLLHYENYCNTFLDSFSELLVLKKPKRYGVLYLGAGTGFWTKIWIDHANPERYRRGSTRMVERGTLKLTRYERIPQLLHEKNDGYYEMGCCLFEIKGVE